MGNWVQKMITAGVLCGALSAAPLALGQDSGKAASDEDRRSPVVLRPAEKTRVLHDMRQYLKGLQEMFVALAKDDMETVATKAREMGRINIYETGLMFPNQAGVKFRELSSLVHEDFEAIADKADKKQDTKAILGDLALTMKRCTSCHESYRLTEMGHSK